MSSVAGFQKQLAEGTLNTGAVARGYGRRHSAISVFVSFRQMTRDREKREAADAQERGNGPKHDVSPPTIFRSRPRTEISQRRS